MDTQRAHNINATSTLRRPVRATTMLKGAYVAAITSSTLSAFLSCIGLSVEIYDDSELGGEHLVNIVKEMLAFSFNGVTHV